MNISRYIRVLVMGMLLIGTACNKEQNLSNLNETLWLRNDGADMPLYVHGNGASKKFILVLHGGPGGSGLEYRSGEYYQPIEDRFAMVYWDQRGSGSSQGSYDESSVTIDQFTDDLYNAVLLLKGKYGSDIKIILLGHSWGGLLGTAYLADDTHESVVDAWINSDGAHNILLLNQLARRMFIDIGNREITLGNNVSDWQEMVDYCEAITDTTNPDPSNWSSLNSFGFRAEGLLSEVNQGASGSIGGALQQLFFSPSSPVTGGLQGAFINNQLFREVEVAQYSDQLHKIDVPTLVLYGRYDFVTPPGLGQEVFDEISSTDKTLIFFENSGHSPMDNQPTDFSNAVIEFVARIN